MAETRRLPSPFGPIDGLDQARNMARLTAYGFGLATVTSLIQSLSVAFLASPQMGEVRYGVSGFAIFLAVVTALLALWQWKRPNRILPVFGLAWALYELSAFLTSALVGAPLGPEGIPVWSPYLSVAGMAACAVLHIGGLRGAMALGREA